MKATPDTFQAQKPHEQRCHAVCAVVVTHNRLALLKRCVEALRAQNRSVDSIVVVNNGSSDGTREWLASQQHLIVVNQDNVGCSAGFCTGIREATRFNPEFIWLMDDDVQPHADCLRTLLGEVDRFPRNSILVPNRLNPEGESINGDRIRIDFSSWYKHDGQPVVRQLHSNRVPPAPIQIEGFTFEGPLLPRQVIEKVGPPNHRFFVIADDTEFALRCREEGIKAFLIPQATMWRSLSERNPTAITDKDYYMIRNGYTYMSLRYGVAPSKYVRPLVWATILAKNRFITNRIPITWHGIATIVQGLLDGYAGPHGKRNS
jgi:GT2 family glycosyltransferase